MSANRVDQADIGLEPILVSHLRPYSDISAPTSTRIPSRNSEDQLLGSANLGNGPSSESSDSQAPSGEEKIIEVTYSLGQVANLWAFEVLTLSAAVLVLVGLILLLKEFDGDKQPEWPDWINLSTIVSILATTLRTLLVVVIASGTSPATVTLVSKILNQGIVSHADQS